MFSLWINFDFNFVLPWVQLYFNWDRQKASPKISPDFAKNFECTPHQSVVNLCMKNIRHEGKQENGQTHYIQAFQTLDDQWNHMHKHTTQNFGTPAKLMMISSAVKWAWVQGCTIVTQQKLINKIGNPMHFLLCPRAE